MSNGSIFIFQNLVSDTIAFLKTHYQPETILCTSSKLAQKFSAKSAPKPAKPQRLPLPLSKKPIPKDVQIQQKTPIKQEPIPNQELPKEKDSMMQLIEKHLPNIRLTADIPDDSLAKKKKQEVAILVFNKEDLPFLKTLAKAIQEHICPVKLFDAKRFDREKSFSLIIAPEEAASSFSEKIPLILLAPIAQYQNNVQRKKELWSAICQSLKSALPKSF